MNISKRAAVLVAGAVVIFAGVSFSAAFASGVRAEDGSTRTEQTPASPASAKQLSTPTAQPASPAAVASSVAPPNGSSGVSDGVPFYDAISDPTLIQYPTEMTEEELARARSWVEMMDLTAKCMATKGYPFEYTLWWDFPITDPSADNPLPESPAKYGTPAYEALYGDPFADNYDPQTGEGCDGEARSQLTNKEFAPAN